MIAGTSNDKRIKLSAQDKENIRKEYACGGTNYSRLAKKYGVTQRTIMLVCNPDTYKEALRKHCEASKIRKPSKEQVSRKNRRYRERMKELKGVK